MTQAHFGNYALEKHPMNCAGPLVQRLYRERPP